jgi:hypothetical protein
LLCDRGDVIGIYFRDQERDIRLHAMGGRVAEDGVTAGSETLFDLLGDFSRKTGKNDRALEVGMVVENGEVSGRGRHVRAKAPIGCLGERLARRSLRGDEFGDAEPGMILEELNEALADIACGAEYCDRNTSV